MAWVAVDKDSTECIYQFRPQRCSDKFKSLKVRRLHDFLSGDVIEYAYSMWLALPKGSIKKLIGKELTWEDEPVELKEKQYGIYSSKRKRL